MVLVSPDTILLSNFQDKKVQMFDTRGQKVSEVKLQHSPLELCLIRKDQAFVVLGKNVQKINIQYNNLQSAKLTKGTMLKRHDLHVLGITTIKDTSLVVSYIKFPWLEVITTDGELLHQYEDEDTGYFLYPSHLTTSPDNYVYVSDQLNSEITKLDFSLQLIDSFSNPLLSTPKGIISISNDQLLVCSTRLVLLNTSTGKSSILLGKQNGIEYPHSLTYCPEHKKLYFAMQNTDRINVYRLS